jgi:hypothetical protein
VKISAKLFALLVVAVLSVASARANNVDPKIIVRDPVGCPSGSCVPITGLTFSFSVPSAGMGVLHFLNASGVTWTSLVFTETGVPPVNISCSSDVFSCSLVAFGQTGARMILTAGNLGGIAAGHSFEIILGCKDCPNWPPGLEFDAVANNAVPEPGTMALLLTGVGALIARRRKLAL